MTNKIELYQDRKMWVAHHSGPLGIATMALFGTTDLPTAFAADCPADYVLSRVRALNPGAEVTLKG